MNRFEPHAHTDYSNIRLLDCINQVEKLIDRAVDIGLSGLAITDHECVSSHVRAYKYYQKIKEKNPNFKLALGNEIYLCPNREPGQKYYHFILIAKNTDGYRALRELSSRAWLNSFRDRGMERCVTTYQDVEEIVAKYPNSLIATTACLGGELSTAVAALNMAEATFNTGEAQKEHEHIVNFVLWCKKMFDKDFYIEIAPGKSKDQVVINKRLLSVANAFDVKIVIGTDAHFLKKEDRYVHKAYLNSKNGEREVDAFYEFSYLQDEKDIYENLKASNFFEENIEIFFNNSMEIYDKIEEISLFHKQRIPQVEVKDYKPVPGYRVHGDAPDYYKVLSVLMSSENIVERYWVNECLNKLKELGKYNDEYLSRLEEEARIKKIISEKLETNMFAYPVTLQHYVDLFWDCGSIVGAGRGSSCSGLNHYLLGITQLDPIKWNLPFWRYLNDERVELGCLWLMLPSCKKRV